MFISYTQCFVLHIEHSSVRLPSEGDRKREHEQDFGKIYTCLKDRSPYPELNY